ncbi:ATP-binding cassette domain-containing protein [Kitasatospora gansuensis]
MRQDEVVAVLGQNGSGKSTLLKLLSGIYLPQPGGGQITWDGVPIEDLDAQAMWSMVARVPQEFARWPLQAAENVHLGHHDGDPDQAVKDAAGLTGFDEAVHRLRSGWRTLLAQGWQGGAELSGGGWQRAAVARAFYRTHREPGLLILDEPTSDLDPRAEHKILHALRDLAKGRITLLVTHNLGNAKLADRIIVVDQGLIVQAGTWDQLADQPDGLFKELLDLQQDRTVPAQRTSTE